jgi:hypothetical protein
LAIYIETLRAWEEYSSSFKMNIVYKQLRKSSLRLLREIKGLLTVWEVLFFSQSRKGGIILLCGFAWNQRAAYSLGSPNFSVKAKRVLLSFARK